MAGVSEFSLQSVRVNVVADSEEGGASEQPGGPSSKSARPEPQTEEATAAVFVF